MCIISGGYIHIGGERMIGDIIFVAYSFAILAGYSLVGYVLYRICCKLKLNILCVNIYNKSIKKRVRKALHVIRNYFGLI